MILGVFNLKSDIGAKQAADVTYTFMSSPTCNNRHRVFVLSNMQIVTFLWSLATKTHWVTQYCIHQSSETWGGYQKSCYIGSTVTTDHGTMQRLLPVTWTDTSCLLIFSSYDRTSPGPHSLLQEVCSMRGHFEIWKYQKSMQAVTINCEFSLPCLTSWVSSRIMSNPIISSSVLSIPVVYSVDVAYFIMSYTTQI